MTLVQTRPEEMEHDSVQIELSTVQHKVYAHQLPGNGDYS